MSSWLSFCSCRSLSSRELQVICRAWYSSFMVWLIRDTSSLSISRSLSLSCRSCRASLSLPSSPSLASCSPLSRSTSSRDCTSLLRLSFSRLMARLSSSLTPIILCCSVAYSAAKLASIKAETHLLAGVLPLPAARTVPRHVPEVQLQVADVQLELPLLAAQSVVRLYQLCVRGYELLVGLRLADGPVPQRLQEPLYVSPARL